MFKNKNESNIIYKCTVRLLEDADILECEFQPFHRGSFLVEFICDQLKIKEKDYFGLRYVDISKQRHWLDLGKSVIKQCKDVDPILFSFRVKFYPADPFRLTGNGRIMLYQQLKRDLRHGRLYCSIGEAAALGSLIVQGETGEPEMEISSDTYHRSSCNNISSSKMKRNKQSIEKITNEEIGDFNEEIHIDNYVSSMNLALRQTETLEKKIMELHKKRQPYQEPTVAIDEFMGIARGLETYGIDPHPVKDHRGSQLYIGINYSGISTFISGKRSQHFRWNEVHKINFEGKMFIAHLSYTDASREPKKHTIGFKCSSNVTCRYLWRCAIEQMLFFTLANSQHAAVVSGGGFFSWGTKFKYTGRTEREILTESINALREQKLTNSSTSKRKASSVPATPSSPQSDLAQIRYSSLPRSTMSEPLGNCTMSTTDGLNNIIYSPSLGYDVSGSSGVQVPSLEPVSEEARIRASSNFENINLINNCNNPESSNFYLKSEDAILYSSPESAIFNAYDRDGFIPPRNCDNIQNSYFHQQSNNATVNANLSTLTTSKANDKPTFDHQFAKGVRKFHFINAFIPSLVFVVIAMTVSAIVVLESESELFKQIRNLPEMISLRYQYYQPLKEFILQKVGRKT